MSKSHLHPHMPVTADQLRLIADRISRRWPDVDKRVSKQSLLNDIAAVLCPGKNWGGLLAELESPATSPQGDKGGALRRLLEGLRRPAPDALPVPARVARPGERVELLDPPQLMSEEFAEAFYRFAGEKSVLGVCLRMHEDLAGISLDVDPLLLVEERGAISAISHRHVDLSDAQRGALLRLASDIALYEWGEVLSEEGWSGAFLVAGPARCLGLVPLSMLGALSGAASESFGAEAEHSVLLLADIEDDPSGAADTVLLANLIGRSLRSLSGFWGDGAGRELRLDLNISPALEETLGPWVEGPGGDVPRHGYWMRGRLATEWSNDRYHEDINADYFAHHVGEALQLALKSEGIDTAHSLFARIRIHEAGRAKTFRASFSQEVQILALKEGRFCEWSVSDPQALRRVVLNIGTWLDSASHHSVMPTSAMPKGSLELLAPRSWRLNTRHFERARKAFEGIGQA